MNSVHRVFKSHLIDFNGNDNILTGIKSLNPFTQIRSIFAVWLNPNPPVPNNAISVERDWSTKAGMFMHQWRCCIELFEFNGLPDMRREGLVLGGRAWLGCTEKKRWSFAATLGRLAPFGAPLILPGHALQALVSPLPVKPILINTRYLGGEWEGEDAQRGAIPAGGWVHTGSSGTPDDNLPPSCMRGGGIYIYTLHQPPCVLDLSVCLCVVAHTHIHTYTDIPRLTVTGDSRPPAWTEYITVIIHTQGNSIIQTEWEPLPDHAYCCCRRWGGFPPKTR